MNIYMSIFFRLVPLIMGAVCLFYGLFIESVKLPAGGYMVAGHVLIALTSICIALFTTAATIIRQIIKRYNKVYKIILPMLGYVVAIITSIAGLYIVYKGKIIPDIVSGNIVFGVGLIACCVSTVATASTKFTLIPKNQKELEEGTVQVNGFTEKQGNIMISIPVICTALCFLRAIYIWAGADQVYDYVAGHVLIGIGFICLSLIMLVYTIVKQIQNTFSSKNKWIWSKIVLASGTINVIWGALILIFEKNPAYVAPGVVMIGLGLICYSISSKVILLALVWRNSNELAKRIPIIPVVTALICLFTSAFLFESCLSNDTTYFVPAHVMVGLGAVCFTLFSIVSILESGTSSK